MWGPLAEARRNTQNLKFKVMDLLEIFIKREERSPLLVDLMLPLYQVAIVNATGTAAQVRSAPRPAWPYPGGVRPATDLSAPSHTVPVRAAGKISWASAPAQSWAACSRRLCSHHVRTFRTSGCAPCLTMYWARPSGRPARRWYAANVPPSRDLFPGGGGRPLMDTMRAMPRCA